MESVKDTYTDVLMDDLSTHPKCPHGPTLLFNEKKDGSARKFYACAACRDRKLCSFFHWADEKFSESKEKIWELERQKLISQEKHNKIFLTVQKMKNHISNQEVDYCHTCNQFVLHLEIPKHLEHDIQLSVSLHYITHPTELLKPLERNKKEAQYLFSKRSIKTIINIAEDMCIKSVVCIGAPRIHEYINNERNGMRSILLDLDRRYHMFYKPQEFCWFNSFNNHFFLDNSKTWFIKFLQMNKGKNIMIIVDPPFGGRLEPLSYTIKSIQALHKELNPHITGHIPVILIYPYFMEPHIVSSLPQYSMSDYKVTYDNHPLFSKGPKAGKRGSPVRIFTNIDLKNIRLPQEEGYKFCKECNRWVSEENVHCDMCMNCTSKNGLTYVHCFKCEYCVKPTWQHCDTCKRCCLTPHSCTSFIALKMCYRCGKSGHKKYNCPQNTDYDGVSNIRTIKPGTKRKKESLQTKQKRKLIT